MMVTIIGAGLAGLACARRLADANIPVRVLEKSDSIGGRVQTRIVNGFQIDSGFQVLLNTYPALQAFPELAGLKLHPFPPGARIMVEHRLHTLSDPFRNPADALPAIVTPVVSIQDKLLMWQLAAELNRRPLKSLWDEPDQTILRFLTRRGFSKTAIELFFRPFIGGITLDESLGTSATVFKFIWSMLSGGLATSPSGGMQAIPNAMQTVLVERDVDISTGTTVQSVSQNETNWTIQTDKGLVTSELVVIATDAWALPELIPQVVAPDFRSQRTLWLAVDRVVDTGPSLILNPDQRSPILTVAPMHAVAPDRAPAGHSLFAVTIRHDCFSMSKSDIIQKFTDVMQRTKLMELTDRVHCIDDQFIRCAQFVQHPQHFRKHKPLVPVSSPRLFVCGEHFHTSSINGALESGIATASEIIRTLCPTE